MVSSSFDFDRALAYALSCVKQEVLSLKDQQMEAVNCKVLSEGKNVFVWFPTGYGKSICYQLLPLVFDVKLGRTNAPLVDRSVILVISPLMSDTNITFRVIYLYFHFTIVLRHVLLLNLRSQPTRPYTINTRPYFFSRHYISEKSAWGRGYHNPSWLHNPSCLNLGAQTQPSPGVWEQDLSICLHWSQTLTLTSDDIGPITEILPWGIYSMRISAQTLYDDWWSFCGILILLVHLPSQSLSWKWMYDLRWWLLLCRK